MKSLSIFKIPLSSQTHSNWYKYLTSIAKHFDAILGKKNNDTKIKLVGFLMFVNFLDIFFQLTITLFTIFYGFKKIDLKR